MKTYALYTVMICFVGLFALSCQHNSLSPHAPSGPNVTANWVRVTDTAIVVRTIVVTSNNTIIINGLHKSLDTGRTWNACAIDSSRLPAVSGVAGGNHEVFQNGNYSTDDGVTWTQVPVNNYSLALMYPPNVLYGGGPNDVYKSTDNGATWLNLTPLPEPSVGTPNVVLDVAVYGHAAIANIYVGTLSGMLYSTNNGSSWDRLPNTSPVHNTSIRSVLTGANNEVIIGTDGGEVYRSVTTVPSFGSPMFRADSGSFKIFALLKTGSLIAVGMYANGGVAISTDGGGSFGKFNNGLLNKVVYSLAYCQGYLFAGTASGVYRTRIQ